MYNVDNVMQVTAIIQNNSLIIPNIDPSQFQQSANEYGLITLDVSILQTSATMENAKKMFVQFMNLRGL